MEKKIVEFEQNVRHNILTSIINDSDNSEIVNKAKLLYKEQFGQYNNENKSLNTLTDLDYAKTESIYDKAIQDITSQLNMQVTKYAFDKTKKSFLYVKMNEKNNAPIAIIDEYMNGVNSHQSGILLIEKLTNKDKCLQNVILSSVLSSRENNKGSIAIQSNDLTELNNSLVARVVSYAIEDNTKVSKLKMY